MSRTGRDGWSQWRPSAGVFLPPESGTAPTPMDWTNLRASTSMDTQVAGLGAQLDLGQQRQRGGSWINGKSLVSSSPPPADRGARPCMQLFGLKTYICCDSSCTTVAGAERVRGAWQVDAPSAGASSASFELTISWKAR